MSEVLQIRISLKGRPLRSYTFAGDTFLIGRDPAADIFLDNTGISRRHARLERASNGFFVEDLGSANGTYLNDEPIKRQQVNNNDVIRVGKFSLWVSVQQDRRDAAAIEAQKAAAAPPDALQGTTVLSGAQLAHMIDTMREEEPAPPQLQVVEARAPAPRAARAPSSQVRWSVILLVVGVVVGVAVGAGAVLFLAR